MEILAIIAFGFIGIRLGVAISNLLSPTVLKDKSGKASGEVSVLIPARNEADKLPVILEKLLSKPEGIREIMVYDDVSTDNTWEVIREFSDKNEQVLGIKGEGPPPGWLGKNHACHQLANKAQGEYLLFLDADVEPTPALVPSLLARFKKNRLSLLSVFPEQRMESPGEVLVVPLMNYILLSLLPLSLTRLSKRPSLSAANGQVMLFDAGTYRSGNYHQMLRMEAVEDIRIMQEMKKQGLRTETVISGGQVNCRMYESFTHARQGFAKNIHHFFGKSYTLMAGFALLTTLAPVFAFLAFGWTGLLIYVACALLLRAITAGLSRQPVLKLVLLHPLLHVTMLAVMWHSWRSGRKKQLEWKGRNIHGTGT